MGLFSQSGNCENQRPKRWAAFAAGCREGGNLLLGCTDRNRDIHHFGARTATCDTKYRGSITGIAPRAKADISLIRANLIGGIKADPAQTFHVNLCPSMGGIMGLALAISQDRKSVV